MSPPRTLRHNRRQGRFRRSLRPARLQQPLARQRRRYSLRRLRLPSLRLAKKAPSRTSRTTSRRRTPGRVEDRQHRVAGLGSLRRGGSVVPGACQGQGPGFRTRSLRLMSLGRGADGPGNRQPFEKYWPMAEVLGLSDDHKEQLRGVTRRAPVQKKSVISTVARATPTQPLARSTRPTSAAPL